MTGMAWGGFDLAEHAGFDGLGKGGVGAVVSGAHVTMSRCSFVSNHAALGGVFYVQGCLPERSNDAPCDEAVASASSRLTLHDCTSSANHAGHGGLAYVTIGAVVDIVTSQGNRRP